MKNKSALTFYTFLFVCFASLMYTGQVLGQENDIFELTNDDELSKVKVKKYKEDNRGKFYNLAQKLHTTSYISNNTINKVYGEGEIKKITFEDSKSFSLLNNKIYNAVELITVTLNNLSDLNNTLDLTTNKNLSSLKYVFVKCNFKCKKQQIKKFVKAKSNSKIRIFYKTESPS
ncbi:hypothetical protein [uncultured Wocania sp.]|uniref:hypothetical protein n=1 Tax=uncultured Wocania sp. TaxID=2834404 RepID=UPI0030FBA476